MKIETRRLHEPASVPVPLSGDVLEGVRFGRSRLLAGGGAVLTALATRMWFADAVVAAPPNGCFGYDRCPSCSGATCTSSGCTRLYCCCPPSGVANQCWQTCAYEGSTLYRFKCCDWTTSSGTRCICRGYVGTC